jgi:hypothetical protein
MKPTIFLIERSGTGKLGTMARPRGNDWLGDEMEALRDVGLDVLVSMLTSTEAADLELGSAVQPRLAPFRRTSSTTL